MKHQFGWGPALVGEYEAADGLTQAVGMLFVPWLVVQVLGEYVDVRWLLVGYLARSAHFLLFALSPNTAFTFCLVPVLLLASTITPRSRTLVSNSVPPSQQAAVMSGFSAVQSLATFSVPAVSLGFSYSVYFCPQLMYVNMGYG